MIKASRPSGLLFKGDVKFSNGSTNTTQLIIQSLSKLSLMKEESNQNQHKGYVKLHESQLELSEELCESLTRLMPQAWHVISCRLWFCNFSVISVTMVVVSFPLLTLASIGGFLCTVSIFPMHSLVVALHPCSYSQASMAAAAFTNQYNLQYIQLPVKLQMQQEYKSFVAKCIHSKIK